MNVQEILQMIQNVDFRLIQAAVLVLILLLFWRAFARISRLYKEVARLNDRLDRTREDVRTMKKPLVETIAPPGGEPNAGSAEESAVSEKDAEPVAPEESFSFSAESFEQPETREEGEESPFDTFVEDSFTFEEEPDEVESQTSVEEEGYQDRLGEDLEQTSWSAAPAAESVSDRLDLDDLRESGESESQELTGEEPDREMFEPEEPAQEDTIGAGSGLNDFSFEEPAEEEPEEEPEEEQLAPEEPAADAFGAETFETVSPPVEEPAPEEPVAEEPSFEEPVAEEPLVKESLAEPAPAEFLAGPSDREAPAEEESAREELPERPSAEPEPEEEKSEILALPADPARPGVNFARCLACNFKLAYPARLSGKGVRCPSCKAKHVLP